MIIELRKREKDAEIDASVVYLESRELPQKMAFFSYGNIDFHLFSSAAYNESSILQRKSANAINIVSKPKQLLLLLPTFV